MLLEIESAIAQKIANILETQTRNVIVRAFPEKLEKVGQPTRKSQVLVGYKRSSFSLQAGHPMTLNMIAEFEVSMEMVSLRSHVGMLPILDAVRFGLIGFVPICGGGRLFPSSESFVDLDESSIWFYNQAYSLPIKIFEGMDYYDSTNPSGMDLHPIEVELPPPYVATQVIAGIRRSHIGNFSDQVLDREATFHVPNNP